MAKLYNLARVSTATVGTGTITLGAAVSGYLTFALSGVANGETVGYAISDGANSEIGTGVYTTAGTTLSRTPTASTNSNAAISLSGAAQVFITPRAEELGKWSNRRVAKTANYTLTEAESGATVALGGSAFFTLTVNSASGYDSDFTCVILNEDGARGKTIAINGITAFTLYPGQSVNLFASNNVWRLLGRSRWSMPPTQNFYVDPVNGLDTNDGLAAGAGAARQTLQSMVNEIFASVDFGGNQATVNIAAGTTETGGLHFSAHGLVGGQGGAGLRIDGGAGATISATSTSCIGIFEGAKIQVSNLTLTTTTGGDCITAGLGGSVEVLTGMVFGACAGSHMNANGPGAVILLTSNYTVSGNAATAHNIATGGGQVNVNGITGVTVSANITVAYWVLTSNFCGANLAGITYTLGGHTVTGKRYEADNFSMINSGAGGATYFPGTVAGSTSGGGVYI